VNIMYQPIQLSAALVPEAEAGAFAEARAWLARELHDGAVQRLLVVAVELERLRLEDPALAVELATLQRSNQAALNELQALLCELRDEPSVDTGLIAHIGDLLTDLLVETSIQASLSTTSWPTALPSRQSFQLRRIVDAALANVRRHSCASRVTVTLQTIQDQLLVITVADDGTGLVRLGEGFGMQSMRDRAELIGGRLTVDATPGVGTTIRCTVAHQPVL
jgi:signal transduction histidine kinase